MNHIIKTIILGLTISLFFSCSTYYEEVLKSNDVDLKYRAAFQYFNAGKYAKAQQIFETLKLTTQGTPQEDTVNFYLGLSNYEYGDYTTAEANFASFIEVYPRSPFAERAEFLRIECLYDASYRYELDQTPTYKAMQIIGEFMYENPSSEHYADCEAMMLDFRERLDRKSFESAKIYHTMEDYKAAKYALKNVLKENADNQYREDVLYYTALSSYKYANNSVPEKQKVRYLDFVDDYYNFVSEYQESKYKKELDDMFEKSQKFLEKNN